MKKRNNLFFCFIFLYIFNFNKFFTLLQKFNFKIKNINYKKTRAVLNFYP